MTRAHARVTRADIMSDLTLHLSQPQYVIPRLPRNVYQYREASAEDNSDRKKSAGECWTISAPAYYW